jgi:hypothetical protein
MDKNKLIENIKNQLKSLMASEVKFAEIKSGDLIISCPDEQCTIGSEVYTIDQDGNNIPLGDGDYKLDSGETITVVNGVVEAMVSTEAPEAVVNAEDMPEEEMPTEEEPVVEEDVTVDEEEDEMGSKKKMKELEERMVKCEKMLEEMYASNNKMAQELSAVAGLPATKSISVEPAEFKSVEDKKSGAGSVDIMAIRERARAGRK